MASIVFTDQKLIHSPESTCTKLFQSSGMDAKWRSQTFGSVGPQSCVVQLGKMEDAPQLLMVEVMGALSKSLDLM